MERKRQHWFCPAGNGKWMNRKKTAQKMLLALKGKLSLFDEDISIIHKKPNSPWQDVILALVNMGYEKKVYKHA